MVRKLIAALLVAALLLPCAAFAGSLSSRNQEFRIKADPALQVVDQEDRIDDAMEQRIIDAIDAIESKHQVDLVVLVTSNTPADYSDSLYRVRDFADDFYDYTGYGMGEDFSGLLYLIDLNNRVQWISTGGVMISYINDMREERILDAAEPYLKNNNWGYAALAAMQQTGVFMDQGQMKGTFIYDEVTGKRLSGIYNPLEPFEILLAAIAGVAVAAVIVGAVSGSYSLKGRTYAYELKKNSTAEMLADEEQYLRESVTRRARSTDSVGGSSSGGGRSFGSGSHRSSSGRSHGGGGRRF